MKNYIFYLSIIALFISCDVAVETDVKVGENKIGYELSDNGEKTSLIAGDMSTIEVWEKYVQAHNDGDLDAIKNLNHDDIKIWGRLDQQGIYNNEIRSHTHKLRLIKSII